MRVDKKLIHIGPKQCAVWYVSPTYENQESSVEVMDKTMRVKDGDYNAIEHKVRNVERRGMLC